MTTNFPPPFLCQKKTSLWQRGSKVYQYILKIKCISAFYLRISILQHQSDASRQVRNQCTHLSSNHASRWTEVTATMGGSASLVPAALLAL